MPHIRATATAVIDAPPKIVYDILADYRESHPQILPKKNFLSINVERGGIGAGTIVTVRIRMFGGTRTSRMEITEPRPGSILVETDIDNGTSTIFTVDAIEKGKRSAVTIITEWSTPGLKGMIERMLAPSALQRIYDEELHNLAVMAKNRSAIAVMEC
jgi:hypothetical protein